MNHFLFNPVDSWFFRESRSMDGAGSSALDSIFPPATSTLLGAIRAQIGNAYHAKNGTNWTQFDANDELATIIGYGNDYKNLKAQGAWLYHHGELYLPCPKNLLDVTSHIEFFRTGDAVSCDLGTVRLPILEHTKAQQPIEQAYISVNAFSQVLKGALPAHDQIVTKSSIVTEEPRLGIERDNLTRRTIDGMLYQTNHLRLEADWAIYLGLDGLDKAPHDTIPSDTLLRLGGEARMAKLANLNQSPRLPDAPNVTKDTQTLIMYLITPLPDPSCSGLPMLPKKLTRKDGKYTTWEGDILGQKIEIYSAITDKPERIGGWDMAAHQSLPVRSFIPAGSCWYLHANGNAPDIVKALHQQFLTEGNDRALGYGQVLIGTN